MKIKLVSDSAEGAVPVTVTLNGAEHTMNPGGELDLGEVSALVVSAEQVEGQKEAAED